MSNPRIMIDHKIREMTDEEVALYFNEDDNATESDYITALQDLGVEVN